MAFFLAAVLSAASCARVHYVLVPQISAVSVRREGKVFRARAGLQFRVTPAPRNVTYSDPGLTDHMNGFAAIAQHVAQSSKDSVQAVGANAAQARERLNRAMDQLRSDAQTELEREEQLYDTVTEGGLSQNQGPQYGFPGGRNAHIRCAPAAAATRAPQN